MEISESAWAKAKEHVDSMPPLPPFKHQVQEAIARAIDQERRECAEIAETTKPLRVTVKPEQWVMMHDDYGEEIGEIKQGKVFKLDLRSAISQAIRNK